MHNFFNNVTAVTLLIYCTTYYFVYSSLAGGGFPSEYCYTVWCAKTRMVWLPNGEKSLKIRVTV